jgi:predicted aconitase with swiveling domain
MKSLTAFLLSALVLLGAQVLPAATIHVPGEAATIQAGINLAQSGDDVLVGPGYWWEHDIVLKAGVVVHSEQGPELTIILAQNAGIGFIAENLSDRAIVDGFTISNGRYTSYIRAGGGISSYSSPLTVRNCVVSRCTGDMAGGIYAWYGEIDIEGCTVRENTSLSVAGGICVMGTTRSSITDCEVIGNQSGTWGAAVVMNEGNATIARCTVLHNSGGAAATGGIRISHSPSFTAEDCVVAHNVTAGELANGAGVSIESSSGTMSGCTIAWNHATFSPGSVAVWGATVLMERNIIAFNSGHAVHCERDAHVDYGCCDLFANADGEIVDCGASLGGNFEEDPRFCDPQYDDFALQSGSPCLPGYVHGGIKCGLVGALGYGCGAIATGACCLPDLSCTVLSPSQCVEQDGEYQGDGTECRPGSCLPTATERASWGSMKQLFR